MRQFLAEAPAWLETDYETNGVSSFALPLVATDEEGHQAVNSTLASLEIEARPVVAGNLIHQPFVRDREDVTVFGSGLPNAEKIHHFGLYVGNGHHVTPEMVSHLCNALRKVR